MIAVQQTPWLSWQALNLLSRKTGPSPILQSWLLEPGSLTQRLRNQGSAPVEIEVMEEGWQWLPSRPAVDLNLRPGSATWVRDVALWSGGEVWFYAHTLIPYSSLVGTTRRLRRWGNRSLGDFLFSHPHPQRSPLSFARFSYQGEPIWARRCIHYRYNKPIMVCEFFPESSPCARA